MSSLALILMLLTGCTEKDDFPVFRGPYLGQNPPGSESQLFMPGLISTNYIDYCIGFLREGRVCVFSIWEKGTYSMYEKDGQWTLPEEIPWQNEQGATDFIKWAGLLNLQPVFNHAQCLIEYERTASQGVHQLGKHQEAVSDKVDHVELMNKDLAHVSPGCTYHVNVRHQQVAYAFNRDQRLNHQDDFPWVLDAETASQTN